MGGYLCTRTERDGRIWLLPPLMYHPWCDLKKIRQKTVLLRPTKKWDLIYRSLEPTAICQLLVLHCFYGMRRRRRLKMALYFEQLVLIWFCKDLNCTLSGETFVWDTQYLYSATVNILFEFLAFLCCLSWYFLAFYTDLFWDPCISICLLMPYAM